MEKALSRLTIVSQLTAVRALHEAIRKDGDSSALLGALVRGYANLGLLTDRLWDGTTWVFKARSLLYAMRLSRQESEKGLPMDMGLWHTAYAQALAGYHNSAVSSIDRAKLFKRPKM